MPVMTMARWFKNPVLLGPKPSVLRALRGVLAGIGVPTVHADVKFTQPVPTLCDPAR